MLYKENIEKKCLFDLIENATTDLEFDHICSLIQERYENDDVYPDFNISAFFYFENLIIDRRIYLGL